MAGELIAASATMVAAAFTGGATYLASRKKNSGRVRSAEALIPSRISLVDRTNEVSQVLRRLRRGEFVVAIEGSIGVGKSALAAEVSHRLLRKGVARPVSFRRFGKTYKWIAWIDARNTSPELVHIARQLSLLSGNQSLSTAPDEEKAAALRAFLAVQPCILVIDNVKISPTSTQDFVNFLRTLPTGSIAIVSTNTPGQLGTSRILLEELQLDHARELLVREARRLDVKAIYQADRRVLDQICESIGGNPRSIALLVLSCLRRPVGLPDLLKQLGTGSGNLSNDLFSSLWLDFDDDEKLAVVGCAYLQGKATTAQISIAAGVDGQRIQDAVDHLWVCGILKTMEMYGVTYFICTPVFSVFVLKTVDPVVVDGMRGRLSAHFVEMFQADWENARAAAPHIDAIRFLVSDLHDAGQDESCLSLFDVTLDIFFTLGLFDDRITLGWVAYAAATRLDDHVRQSLALSVVSSTHSIRGEHIQAQEPLRLGAIAAETARSGQERARQRRCRGYDLFRSGRPDEALREVDGVEVQAEAAGDLNNVVDILALRSAAQWHVGNHSECAHTVDLFLHYCDVIPWRRGRAYPIREKAELAMMRRSYLDARLFLDEARSIAVEYQDVRQVIRIDLSMARLFLFTGHFIRSMRLSAEVSRRADELSVVGERVEAKAVALRAAAGLASPWRWSRKDRNPQTRFTDEPIGGD